MTYLLCSLFNSDTMEYSAPFISKTRKTAISDFSDRILTASKKSRSFDPNDWSLFCLGDFNVTKGKINVSDPIILINGKDVDLDDDIEE